METPSSEQTRDATGPQGRTRSYYMQDKNAELVKMVAAAFGISESEAVNTIIEARREELIEAIAHKTKKLPG